MDKPTNKDELMDFLLRDIPREAMAKLRAAAAIHGYSLKSYMIVVLEAHLEFLEERGMVLRVEESGKTKKLKGKT